MVQYKYDAWGNCKVLNASGGVISDVNHIGNINPFRYRSYFYDSDTQLYYLNARYYDPQIGRFISPDDISYLAPDTVNGLNLYAYCLNNPVMYSDPSGHFGITLTLLIAASVGLAIGGSVEVGKQIYNGGNWNWDVSSWNWWEIGKGALLGAAVGFAFGLGGAAGGILGGAFKTLSIAGKALSISQSIGLLLGTAATTNFAAGVGAYTLDVFASETRNFNILKGMSRGMGQAGKGLLSFFTGGMFVSSGLWNVGIGAHNSLFSTLIARPVTKFIVNYIPNYIFDNTF